MIRLKGMTWDHSRGYDPMVATSAEYSRRHPNVTIEWEKRSLQAFADFPIEQLATEYDLIVIDHPHVGFISREGCLLALDQVGREKELAELACQSLGGSHETYQYDGRQWALAIDAATQVACYRPDLIQQAPTRWSEVIELARQGKVLWPVKPVDSLMSFFTLAANRGTPCRIDGKGELIFRRDGLAVLDAMLSVIQHVPRECLAMNPIETYERLANEDRFVYCPLGYGYTNYSRSGYRKHLLKFTDIPALGNNGPRGSCIGGTGIAVSSRCKFPDVAADYAFWIAGAECQRTLYFDSGGQPGNAAAWDDAHCNAAANDFSRGTRRTLDTVYLRPRYPGYMMLQDKAGDAINAFLAGGPSTEQTLSQIQAIYEESSR